MVREQVNHILPVSMRDNKPTIYSIRILNNRPDGLPDGVHCGAWKDTATGKIWKSLYGRPYANSGNIIRTQEDTFLSKFANEPFFPKNWEVIASNKLWWLVRDEAITITPEEYKDIDQDSILQIEQAIYKVNAAGWAINDYITLLIDKKDYHVFIGDLSCAFESSECNDYDYIERFFKLCKRERLVSLRRNARHVLHELHYEVPYSAINSYNLTNQQLQTVKDYKHIYASFNRPISSIWASLGDAIYKHEAYPNWNGEVITPWSWVITKEPLSEDKVKSYELVWGWSKR